MADEFETDKGIKEDFDGIVTDAFFQAGDRGTNLVLKILADDKDQVESFYSIGTDWASFDGGETIEHPSKTSIRANSQLAVLVEKAMLSGAESVIRQRSSENGSKGQRTAKLWPGLKFHWDVVANPYDFPDRETGEQRKGTSYKSYPSRFLGEQTVAQAPESSDEPEAVPADIIARLKVLAQSKPFPEWVDEALTIDYVRENMLNALSDESFYNSLKG